MRANYAPCLERLSSGMFLPTGSPLRRKSEVSVQPPARLALLTADMSLPEVSMSQRRPIIVLTDLDPEPAQSSS